MSYYYRPSSERGKANFGWLDSHHSFSFGHYYDPEHMGFSVLRVINDDRVAAGAGFDTHGHRDMEIISYITQGSIEHEDSMGNRFVIPAGDIQRMSAGRGVTHSEYNHSKEGELTFLQIWIEPNVRGIEPGYEQKPVEQSGQLTELVTPDGRNGTLMMHQNASISRLVLSEGESIQLDNGKRSGYLHGLEGSADADGYSLANGDGLGVDQNSLTIKAGPEGFCGLWFDLPSSH